MTGSKRDFQKFTKLLGMVSSDQDGEALAAARKATAWLKANNLAWPDVIREPEPSEPVPAIPQHVETAKGLLTHPAAEHCTPFERNFLVGILAFQSLSAKQAELLEKLSEKLENAGKYL